MLLSAVMLMASGLVVSTVAELTARGVLGPNGGAGIRLASVMRSKAAWTAGHRAARAWLHAGAAALIGSGVLGVVAPKRIVEAALPIGMALALGFLIVSGVVASRAARRSDAPSDDR
ncbi:SdpI family protein [Curtobacterium flaccumfaciens pv. oortii]|uniref:SdpI family protein n=1 Tax=Curtobacterium flaccumfaciens TaxID=2035 RepID=UPI00265930FD|nr:SdpI family protein [Curtobacterium flaccumfaciens]MCS5523970.1 SdpI family protein [Curtobacterium flaccumfaciens pv. oortii]